MIKTRIFPESNYKSIWFNGKTIRIALDQTKPITELEYPEFYDIKITSKCQGQCPWCYMDSKINDQNYDNIVEKVLKYFGQMDSNQRPFQVAIGGGEPTEHPLFVDLLKAFKELDIEPNYTTNGMFMRFDDQSRENIINATVKYCGGVALSCHPHLKKYWETAAYRFSKESVKLNFHIIISDRESIDYFVEIYDKWNKYVDYFVLLPYGNIGRAPKKEIDWEYLLTKLPEDQHKLAFGANFYPYLLNTKHNIKVSLYEPEIMSKFIILEGSGTIYPSSFMLNKPLKTDLFV